jgi:tetratricopeptide (TPR) repeat protein
MKLLPKVAFALSFLLAIAFSFKALREPDLWWQIKTGEWILQHRQVPTVDVFSFTHQGVAWINIKWGFEVLAAIITNTFGADCVFILQAITTVLLLWFLWKLSLFFLTDKEKSFSQNSMLAFVLLVPFLLASIEYRIIGRPEMTSHLMTVVFMFILLSNRFKSSKVIYWLIPLQCVWANFHEAFAIGIVLISIFFFAAVIELKILKLNEVNFNSIKTLGIVLSLSVASIFINPYGYKMLLQPLAIFGQVFENKFTTELFSISTREFWQKEAWMAIVWLIIFIALLIKISLNNKKDLKQLFTHVPLAYLIVVIAFIYLSSTAFRNIIFLILVLFPATFLLLFNLIGKYKKIAPVLSLIAVLFSITFYVFIVLNKYYELTNSRDRFGLEVRPDYNAVGAAEFVIKNKIEGKCFSDYLISSYLLWKIPGFETFIDLRDLDVFPASFFETFTEAVMMPEKFIELDKKYNFNYAVLYRPQFNSLHKYLSEGNGYKLIFADAVAAVYVKTTDSISTINIDLFKDVPTSQPTVAASILNKVLNSFHQPSVVSLAENKYAAANYFMNIDKPDIAAISAQQILTTDEAWKGNELLGQIYYNQSNVSSNDSATILLQTAGAYFTKALQQKDDYFPALMGLGAVYFQQRFLTQAKEMFAKASGVQPSSVNAWLSLAACYKSTLQQAESLDEAIICFEKADKLNANNPIIQFELGMLYFQKNDCKKSVERLQKVKGFNGLSEQENTLLQNCLRQCGAPL